MVDGSRDEVSGGGSATDPLRALQIGEEQRSQGHARTTRHRRQELWIGAAVVGIAITAGAVWLTLPTRPTPVQVMTVMPASSARSGLFTAGGYVRHARVVNVVARASGLVATLRVSEGDVVREGDVIATIHEEELAQQVAEGRANLRAAQARLAELQAGSRYEEIAGARARADALRLTDEQLDRERDRNRALAEAGVISAQAFEETEYDSLVARKTLEAAQQALALLEAGPRPEAIAGALAATDAARARLARAADLLARTEIRAPLSGRVLRKFLEVGAVVSGGLPYAEGDTTLGPGSPIVAIGQLEELEAVADINQTDLGRLSLGVNVEVSADTFPGRTYQARLARVSPRADRNKNTVEVTVRFNDPVPRELVHDMSVKLSFLGGHQATNGPRELLIPASAIAEQAGAKVVFVVENGHVRPRRIAAGPPRPSKLVSVEDGLVAGDVVVIAHPEALKDGMEVSPMSAAMNEGEDRE
jgi:HlyD family secretion protein